MIFLNDFPIIRRGWLILSAALFTLIVLPPVIDLNFNEFVYKDSIYSVSLIMFSILILILDRKVLFPFFKIGKRVLISLIAIPVLYMIFILFLNLIFGTDIEGKRGFWEYLGSDPVYTLLLFGVIVPVGEEIFFRLIIHANLSKRFDQLWSIYIGAFLFMLAHVMVNLYPYTEVWDKIMNGTIGLPIGTFLLGLACSFLLVLTRSIWSSILLHSICNLSGPVLMFYLPTLFEKVRMFYL